MAVSKTGAVFLGVFLLVPIVFCLVYLAFKLYTRRAALTPVTDIDLATPKFLLAIDPAAYRRVAATARVEDLERALAERAELAAKVLTANGGSPLPWAFAIGRNGGPAGDVEQAVEEVGGGSNDRPGQSNGGDFTEEQWKQRNDIRSTVHREHALAKLEGRA